MTTDEGLLDLAKLLSTRLERLSADSTWARRASGLRGSLLKAIEAAEKDAVDPVQSQLHLERLVRRGFEILESAARELL
jgi:hypothetical protein